jgi:putative phosphotransacetylase
MDKIPIEVSARHVHLSQKDLETLFGKGYEIKEERQLTQASDFCAKETITIKSENKKIENVRVIGPLREKTQVEISKTDAVFLGVNPPLRLSGDLEGSSKIILEGPEGEAELEEGLVIARRHIHCSPEEAKKAKINHGQIVSVQVQGERALIFHCVEVRVKDGYKICLQIDTDEGNAAGINKKAEGFLLVLKRKT